jgi:hypothetical protein
MAKIISSRNPSDKQKLTAQEFYRQWTGDHIPANCYETSLQFAEAYRAESTRFLKTYIKEHQEYRQELVRRAAELLRKWEHPGIDVEWLKQRSQWLRDAGMEK